MMKISFFSLQRQEVIRKNCFRKMVIFRSMTPGPYAIKVGSNLVFNVTVTCHGLLTALLEFAQLRIVHEISPIFCENARLGNLWLFYLCWSQFWSDEKWPCIICTPLGILYTSGDIYCCLLLVVRCVFFRSNGGCHQTPAGSKWLGLPSVHGLRIGTPHYMQTCQWLQ